jgi:hypothetical protein
MNEAREEIRILKALNVNENIMKQNNLDNCFKSKYLKSRCPRFSAGDVGIKMCNRFRYGTTLI